MKDKKAVLFKQYRAIMTPKAIITALISIGLVFVAIGVTFFVLFNKLVTVQVRYDKMCRNYINTTELCPVTVQIPEDMNGTVSFFYKLDGFYQNFRLYKDSKSAAQLSGEFKTYSQLSGCNPLISVNNSKDLKDLYLPCGMMPLSFFNDSYYFHYPDVANFSEKGISWTSDRESVYKPLSDQYTEGIRWLDSFPQFIGGQRNEHFIVWMRTAAFPKFIKLYGRCTHCYIPKDNYTVYVGYNYPLELFSGGRWIVISMTSGIGGGSNLIAISYVASGGLSLMIGLCFLVQTLLCPRKLGDITGFARKH